MHLSRFALAAPLAALVLCAAPAVRADDAKPKPAARAIVFDGGVARFDTTRDVATGRMTFRLADPAVKITEAPVVVFTTDAGPKEVRLTPVEGQPGTWYVTHDMVKRDRFDGQMRIVVGGTPYTAPLWTEVTGAVPAGTTEVVRIPTPRHSGRVIAFDACNAYAEVVQDASTGQLTIYTFDDVKFVEAPVVTIVDTTGPVTTTVTELPGTPGVWRVQHDAFKTQKVMGRIRVMVDGRPCETTLRGGHIVTVEGGPAFEVVRDYASPGSYTFYTVEERLNGKPYTIENPQVVLTTPEGPRTVQLTRVPDDPRAWRLVGLDANVREPLDGSLKFTLFGKSLETRLGLSGAGVSVR
jgi:hypothetical protein